jgi:hypothetical protein
VGALPREIADRRIEVAQGEPKQPDAVIEAEPETLALIVPAVIFPIGRWNWWLPSWPARLRRAVPAGLAPPSARPGKRRSPIGSSLDAGHFAQEDAHERVVPELVRFLAKSGDQTEVEQSAPGG